MKKEQSEMPDVVFYSLAISIILFGIVVIAGMILYSRSRDKESSASLPSPEPTLATWSEGCERINTLLEAPRTMLIQDDMAVTLSLTAGAKAFKAGEIINVEGISTPESTSWIHFLQIDRILADGTIQPALHRASIRGYPDSYAEVVALTTTYTIPEDGNYNFRIRLIFFEQRSANEGRFNRAWCSR